MLSIETRINGTLIGVAYVHNELYLEGKEEGECVYLVEYHRLNKEPPVIRFNVKHKREEGAEKLSLLIYKELDKRLKKENKPKEQ
jgi:hypothetical protein